MSQAVTRLIKKARSLTPQERGAIALEMLDSLPQPGPAQSEIAWQKELQKRIDDLDSGRVQTIPWTQVSKEMDALLD